MPGGLWLNNASSRCIINAMWVSLIKWHSEKLTCSPGGAKSLHSSPFPSNVPAALGSCGRPSQGLLAQRLRRVHRTRILISLCVSPQMSCGVWYAGMWLPSPAAARKTRRSALVRWLHPAGFPESSAEEDWRPDSWKQPLSSLSWPDPGLFPPDLFTRTSCVTFPRSHQPELGSLPCTLHGLHGHLHNLWSGARRRVAVMCALLIWMFSLRRGDLRLGSCKLLSFHLLGRISYDSTDSRLHQVYIIELVDCQPSWHVLKFTKVTCPCGSPLLLLLLTLAVHSGVMYFDCW